MEEKSILNNSYLNTFIEILNKVEFTKNDVLSLKINIEQAMNDIKKFFIDSRLNNNKVFFIGNGGSAGIAIHMTADFMKNGRIMTQSLYDPSTITCLGNDYGYEYIFSQQLEILFKENDLLIAISSSGNSVNIINSIKVARDKCGNILTFSGFNTDNAIRKLGDYNVYVPISHYGIVESIHNLILQQLIDSIIK